MAGEYRTWRVCHTEATQLTISCRRGTQVSIGQTEYYWEAPFARFSQMLCSIVPIAGFSKSIAFGPGSSPQRTSLDTVSIWLQVQFSRHAYWSNCCTCRSCKPAVLTRSVFNNLRFN